MATILTESFEGSNDGFDNSGWTVVENNPNSIVNQDSSIPGTAPPNAGSQCCSLYRAAGEATSPKITWAFSPTQAVIYLRFYFYLGSDFVLASGNADVLCYLYAVSDSSGASRLFLENIAGQLKFGARYTNSSHVLSTPVYSNISIQTWYCIENKVNVSAGTWEVKINESSIGTGSDLEVDVGNINSMRYWNGAIEVATGTIYVDLIKISDSGWIGMETSAPSVDLDKWFVFPSQRKLGPAEIVSY